MYKKRQIPVGKLCSDTDALDKLIMQMAMESSEPITLLIDSVGGNLKLAGRVEDTISMLRCPVDGIVVGNCGSAAVCLLLSCRNRSATPNARFFFHVGVITAELRVCPDHLSVVFDTLQERVKEVDQKKFNLYHSRTGISRLDYDKLLQGGSLAGASYASEWALENNFIDEITDEEFELF